MQTLTSFYMSYDGLTDPLGQSQVLPYIIGLRLKGVRMVVFSFEKEERLKFVPDIEAICKANDIEWVRLKYTKRPPIISTIYDVLQLKQKLKKSVKAYGIPDIVHCRGYITAMAGLWMKRKYGSRFVFDMRGFFADERVDGGLWNLQNPLYKRVYKYFKAKELQFFSQSDAIISLTEAGKKIIEKMTGSGQFPMITVIPCCADLDHFNRNNTTEDGIQKLRIEFNIKDDDFIISYLGSLGTWYMPEEMMDFFSILQSYKPNSRFLWVTPDKPEDIKALAARKGVSEERLIIRYSQRKDLPNILSLSDLSIFFIKPVFSKQASSPTKMGELMGLGIPLLCNSGVGDVDEIINNTGAGLLVDRFDEESYRKCCLLIDKLLEIDKKQIIEGAHRYYSLNVGVDKYFNVYNKLI